ncbi:MAG TPA: NAD(P)H-dependent oxidoreductase [Terriglobales bacterium]|nr:NAD(P)H-dependent oxidoreductase [Terriglobales bacterium]
MAKDGLTIVGLGGSLALRSSSLAALRIALEGVAEAGATTELLDLRQLSLPMFDPADANPPDSVRRMCDRIHAADGLIWSSPMYNGTISGSFKNALDWLKLLGDRKPPYLTDKVVPTKWSASSALPAACKASRPSTRWSSGARAPWLGSPPGYADCAGEEGL